MKYLLDTNVISELIKRKPNEKLVSWIKEKDSTVLFISVITLGEIRKGINGIKDLERVQQISLWLEIELPQYFENRILNIDQKVTDLWGQLQSKERPSPATDALIAATAKVHQLSLVTRNTKDFIHFPIELINPWDD